MGALLSNPIILGLPLISFWKTVEIITQVSPTRGVLKRPATDPELPTTKVGHWTMSIKVAAALVLPCPRLSHILMHCNVMLIRLHLGTDLHQGAHLYLQSRCMKVANSVRMLDHGIE